VLPNPYRNTLHEKRSILSTLPEIQILYVKLADRSDELIIPVTPHLFNHCSDIMLVKHRSHAIASGHMFEPFAHFADIQSTPHV
jgi:hypothetical protein